jgi:hypothetical protein
VKREKGKRREEITTQAMRSLLHESWKVTQEEKESRGRWKVTWKNSNTHIESARICDTWLRGSWKEKNCVFFVDSSQPSRSCQVSGSTSIRNTLSLPEAIATRKNIEYSLHTRHDQTSWFPHLRDDILQQQHTFSIYAKCRGEYLVHPENLFL